MRVFLFHPTYYWPTLDDCVTPRLLIRRRTPCPTETARTPPWTRTRTAITRARCGAKGCPRYKGGPPREGQVKRRRGRVRRGARGSLALQGTPPSTGRGRKAGAIEGPPSRGGRERRAGGRRRCASVHNITLNIHIVALNIHIIARNVHLNIAIPAV
eukprot:6106317-Pyramimonas_sp.AAC.3